MSNYSEPRENWKNRHIELARMGLFLSVFMHGTRAHRGASALAHRARNGENHTAADTGTEGAVTCAAWHVCGLWVLNRY